MKKEAQIQKEDYNNQVSMIKASKEEEANLEKASYQEDLDFLAAKIDELQKEKVFRDQ
jgi:hypothetical protein